MNISASLIAQTSEPIAQELIRATGITAAGLVLVIGAACAGIGSIIKSWWDGRTNYEKMRIQDAHIQANARATATLIDANKMNQNTPDVDPQAEAVVKAAAAQPTIDIDLTKDRLTEVYPRPPRRSRR